MKIHEYQGKELLRAFGVTVPQGFLAVTVDVTLQEAERLSFPMVVKAQIHAGGRGKGGGVRLVKNKAELQEAAKSILGMQLVTHQTGPEGKKVKKIWVEQACDIARELYLGVVLDRSRSRLAFMASLEGGMEIEEVAHKNPEKIFKVWVDPAVGLQSYQARDLAFALALSGNQIKNFVVFAQGIYAAYIGMDASLMEINPLVVTKSGDLLALDAKVNLDDNALFRHPEFKELLDPEEEDPTELEAQAHNLNYVRLNGNIGCMVNGAGLAMATMDIIKFCGGWPANFLDVGGGVTPESVTEGFKIILRDKNVKAIFVNIFGGIVKCDMVADGIIKAAKELGIRVPVVVRLLGNRAEEGATLLNGSGLSLTAENDFTKAAQKVVSLAKGK